MNYFTKKELKNLLKIMDHCYLDVHGQELGIKIQSLIDNYCEHEEREIMGWVKKCQKCDMKLLAEF